MYFNYIIFILLFSTLSLYKTLANTESHSIKTLNCVDNECKSKFMIFIKN